MKKSNIVLLILIAVTIGVIVTVAGDFSTYETFATARQKEGREFQVIGKLDTTRVLEYNPEKDANLFRFHVIDKTGEIRPVVFYGTKPTDFEKAESVVLTGKMLNGEFKCSKILMKCPSKYKNDQVAIGKA